MIQEWIQGGWDKKGGAERMAQRNRALRHLRLWRAISQTQLSSRQAGSERETASCTYTDP